MVRAAHDDDVGSSPAGSQGDKGASTESEEYRHQQVRACKLMSLGCAKPNMFEIDLCHRVLHVERTRVACLWLFVGKGGWLLRRWSQPLSAAAGNGVGWPFQTCVCGQLFMFCAPSAGCWLGAAALWHWLSWRLILTERCHPTVMLAASAAGQPIRILRALEVVQEVAPQS